MLTKTKQVFSKKSLGNLLFIVLLAALLLVPSVKAAVIRGLLEIGFYNPKISTIKNNEAALGDIRFKDAKGRVITLADCKGKVVFLNFWATWCPPCLAEMPSIHRFYEQFKNQEIVFILVDADGNFSKSQAFMERKKYGMPIYAMASPMPEQIFKGALPTTLVFDRQGRISFQGEGMANYSSKSFTDFINQLLKQK